MENNALSGRKHPNDEEDNSLHDISLGITLRGCNTKTLLPTGRRSKNSPTGRKRLPQVTDKAPSDGDGEAPGDSDSEAPGDDDSEAPGDGDGKTPVDGEDEAPAVSEPRDGGVAPAAPQAPPAAPAAPPAAPPEPRDDGAAPAAIPGPWDGGAAPAAPQAAHGNDQDKEPASAGAGSGNELSEGATLSSLTMTQAADRTSTRRPPTRPSTRSTVSAANPKRTRNSDGK